MSSTVGPRIITSNLIFGVDPANPKSYSGTGTAWNDLASGFNGTLMNGPTFSSSPTPSINSTGGTMNVQFPIALGTDATISLWVKNTSTYEGLMTFSLGGDNYAGGDYGLGPDVWVSSGVWSWNTGDGSVNAWTANPSIGATNIDWHNIVATNEAATNAKLYVDGALVGTANYRSCAVTTSGPRFFLGRYAFVNPGYNFVGKYGVVYVHSRALTAAEVLQNYNALKSRYL
jgi:hypothetical protein